MTDLAEEIDLDAAAEGVKSLYKASTAQGTRPRRHGQKSFGAYATAYGLAHVNPPYRGKETTEGGIYIPNQVLNDTQIQTVVGYVVKQGASLLQGRR